MTVYMATGIVALLLVLLVPGRGGLLSTATGNLMVAVLWPVALILYTYLWVKKRLGFEVAGDSPAAQALFELEVGMCLAVLLGLYLFTPISQLLSYRLF